MTPRHRPSGGIWLLAVVALLLAPHLAPAGSARPSAPARHRHAPAAADKPAAARVAARAVAFALAQRGKPYRWAASGPDAYDCSGLTWAAYRAHGITIPRDADAQFAAGTPVPLARLLPGDLLFYEHPVVGHVAMYAGGGRMIESPNSRSEVRIVPVRTSDFRGARRFL
jgi:peptidoglycan DL-endopeptidase CwlO